MEFTQLIAPNGEWGKVWLAAHWERRLNKQDFIDIDLRALVASFLARRAILSLRATGHLLVGSCKAFAKKCAIFEEEVQEVSQKLLLAFSDRSSRQGDDAGGGAGQAGVANRFEALLREVDLAKPLAEDLLLGGKRHVARLEDITERKTSSMHLPADFAGVGQGGDELFGAMTGEQHESVMRGLREFLSTVLPPGTLPPELALEGGVGLDTQPLVGADAEPEEDEAAHGSKRLLELDTPTALDNDTPMPLDMDLPPPEEGGGLGASRDSGLDDADWDMLHEAQGPEHGPARRRKRNTCHADDVITIPKAQYQAFVNDRRSLTRDSIVDYRVVLPHYSPRMGSSRSVVSSIFSDLCPDLTDVLKSGTDVARRVRRRRCKMEMDALPVPEHAAAPLADLPGATEAAIPALLLPHAKGVAGEGASASSRAPTVEGPRRDLLKDAPRTMSAVVLFTAESEGAAGVSEARVGYSGRTEKMHRYLAGQFDAASSDGLSYQRLCRAQAAGRRELVAGAFFELLVLKTNGVVGLDQESPSSDIRISKASQWAS